MNDIEKLFSASIEDIKKGYVEEKEYFECLLCGDRTEKGIIYQENGHFYDSEKFMKIHVEKEHGSLFEYLIGLDKKHTGLSEHQSKLLKLFYEGKNDSEVQKEMGIGSSSTIRNHRFMLKEKERQAKLFLVIMELLKESGKKICSIDTPHKTAKMVDDRYNITSEENESTLMKFFPYGLDGPLKTFDIREKYKLIVLKHIAKRFDVGRLYTEKEVNEILKEVYDDFVTLRRYFIEYGLMDREKDGSYYWLKEDNKGMESKEMDNRKELIQQYKEKKQEAGVYQIRNTKNGKIFVTSTPNFKTINGKKFQLNMGSCKNKELQKEWNEYGEDAFVFEILEVLKEKDGYFDKKEELKKLEEKWLKSFNLTEKRDITNKRE